jgi:succinate dehydrogenase / fumarate reductase cytochrome b subunit
LLADDGGESFNVYAYFMTHNPLIKTISYGLYAFILIHAVQGIALSVSNRGARKSRYAVSNRASSSAASRNMGLLGILILAFIFIHMGDFWYKMKFTDSLTMATYASFDVPVKNLYTRVATAFEQPALVIAYVVGQIVLAIHLWHGFQSAFQTLGINHKKYTPAIKLVGKVYSVLVPLGFAIIPIYYFLVLNK